jgi:hypothetical protein
VEASHRNNDCLHVRFPNIIHHEIGRHTFEKSYFNLARLSPTYLACLIKFSVENLRFPSNFQPLLRSDDAIRTPQGYWTEESDARPQWEACSGDWWRHWNWVSQVNFRSISGWPHAVDSQLTRL